MKVDLPIGPIVLDGDFAQAKPLGPSNAEIRNYILAMIDQLSELADDSGEIRIGAMLAEVAKRSQA
jgi:hypothetical protein